MIILIWLIAIAIAITIHEFAHAYVADRLGDPTARALGRLSLNPIRHYDPIGTTMLLVTAIVLRTPFGWAKPVPYDPYNLQNPKRDSMLIALAGPVSNILLAIPLSLLLRYFLVEVSVLNVLFTSLISVNIFLAIFNLIPIHPLDGSKVITGLLPDDMARDYMSIMNRFGFLILIFMILPLGGTAPIFSLIYPVIQFILNLLLP
jgi:Zn-dependent protease